MKITRTDRQVKDYWEYVKSKTQGCDVCPCCGKTENKYMPSFDTMVVTSDYSLFKGHWKVKHYACEWCGARWESDRIYDSMK